MSGTPRTRELNNYGTVTGTYWNVIFGTQYKVSNSIGTYSFCDDIVGSPTTANPLELYHDYMDDHMLDGVLWSGNSKVRELTSIPMRGGHTTVPEPRTKYPYPGVLEKSNKAWEILSATNPNVPHVEVPSFVGELKDLPMLVRDWGGNLLRKAAKGHISWQFAIKPMYHDIRKMLQFQQAVNHRMNWLRKLRDGENMKRRHRIGREQHTTDWSNESTLHSSTCIVKGRWREHYSKEEWGTVQWKLASWFQIPENDDELQKLALRLAFDISLDGGIAAVWNLLPWTWLIDWFVGIGDVIDATRNTVPMTHSHLCLMRTSVANREYELTDVPAWVTVSGNRQETRTRKDRIRVEPVIPFPVTVPAITGRQWSILGALAYLKG